MEVDEAFRVDREIRYHLQERTYCPTYHRRQRYFVLDGGERSFGWGGWVDIGEVSGNVRLAVVEHGAERLGLCWGRQRICRG